MISYTFTYVDREANDVIISRDSRLPEQSAPGDPGEPPSGHD